MNQERGEKIQRARGECPLLGFYAGRVGLGEGYGRRGGRTCPKPRAQSPRTLRHQDAGP